MLSKVNINDSIRVNTQPAKSNKAKDTFKKLVKDAANMKDCLQDVSTPTDKLKEELVIKDVEIRNGLFKDSKEGDLSTVDNIVLAALIGNAELLANQDNTNTNTTEELAAVLAPAEQALGVAKANNLSTHLTEQQITAASAEQNVGNLQNKLANAESGEATETKVGSTVIQDLNGESVKNSANDSNKILKNGTQHVAENTETTKSPQDKPQVEVLSTEKATETNESTAVNKLENVISEGKETTKNNELNMSTLLPKEEPKFDIPKVSVKVGESVNVNSKDFPGDIAEKIIYNTDGKSNEFEIQLNPRELGKLNIKVVFESGRAEVSLVCSNPKTLSLLAENARGICSIIEANTGNQVTVNIQENKDFFNEQQNDGYDGKGQNSNQNESDRNSKQQNERTSVDFIQQLRLGLVDSGEEINYYNNNYYNNLRM